MRPLVVVLLCLASTCACGSSPSASSADAMPDAPPDATTMTALERKDLPAAIDPDVDLLFMIDDSPAMNDKQANLIASLPRFLDALATLPGGMPDVHIGVVTSDLGTKGSQDVTPGPGIGTLGQGGCAGLGKAGNLQVFGAPVSGVYLSDVARPDGTRIKNYPGALSDVLATMASAGAGGCGFEQPLEAIRQALLPSNAVNQGFLRPNALLVVVLLTDEDDCSVSHASLYGDSEIATLGPQESFRCTRFGVVCDDGGATPDAMNRVGVKRNCHPAEGSALVTSVAGYADFLKSLKVDPGRVVVASIAGTLDPFQVELRKPPPPASSLIPALAHSCGYIGGDGEPEVADPPVRIAALLEQFPNHSATTAICQTDLTLQHVLVPVRNAMLGSPCIDGALADVDPATPGDQHGCEVTLVTDHEAPLPRCAPEDGTATNPPCWRLAADPMTCARGDHTRLEIEGMATLPATAHVLATCPVLVSG
jgi:hypothetical protein